MNWAQEQIVSAFLESRSIIGRTLVGVWDRQRAQSLHMITSYLSQLLTRVNLPHDPAVQFDSLKHRMMSLYFGYSPSTR